jgi:hypothetical protein
MCRVADRAAFDRGQRAWAGLRGVPGFLGQGGGWGRREPGLAHVFGCWADRRSYEEFMAAEHDRMAPAQAGTYNEITVDVFERRCDVGGPFPAGFADASVVRLAHCRVHPAEVWNRAMIGAPGMLCGVLAKRDESEFLVLTLWRSAAGHERLLGERFLALRQRSGAAHDLDRFTADVIKLEPAWTVLS